MPVYQSYPPSLWAPVAPDKGSASPGDVFTEPTVTAQDAANAAKLGPLGYVADPITPWTAGQAITVSTFKFYWNGTAWTAGIAPVMQQQEAEQEEEER